MDIQVTMLVKTEVIVIVEVSVLGAGPVNGLNIEKISLKVQYSQEAVVAGVDAGVAGVVGVAGIAGIAGVGTGVAGLEVVVRATAGTNSQITPPRILNQ